MAVIGRPTESNSAYSQVTMAPKRLNRELDSDKISADEKEKLLNKITGYKPKSIYQDKPGNEMDKDDFLKLLTHQLQNQDPTNPVENGKMAGELAQFSQLEQLANLNSKFDNFNQNKAVESQFYGASFLGKEVVTTGQTLRYEGDSKEADMLFRLDKNASKVLVRIHDSMNNIIGEVWKENIGRGNQTFTWDGTSLDGGDAAAGDYRIQVHAWDESSDPIHVETKTTGTVESVFFENGETVLLVDGKKVFLRDVDSFHMPRGEANSPGQNLPLDAVDNSRVKLNNVVPNNLVPNNKEEEVTQLKPTTGITDVYDF